MFIIHLKYTQYIFKKEDFILLIITKNVFGEFFGSVIYGWLNNNNSYAMNAMGMVLNFSWGLLGAFGFTLYLEFNTIEKKLNSNKVENKKIEKFRTTVTSDIQGEELREIDNRDSIISVDDTEDNTNINKNKENQYNLDDYIKKYDIK